MPGLINDAFFRGGNSQFFWSEQMGAWAGHNAERTQAFFTGIGTGINNVASRVGVGNDRSGRRER